MNNDERKDDLQRPDDNRPGDLPKGNQEPTPKPPADDPGGADPGDGATVLHVKLPEYDTELDPESPDFNPGKWAEMEKDTAEEIQAALRDTLAGFRDRANIPPFPAILEPVKGEFANFIAGSGLFDEITEQIADMIKLTIDTEKLNKAITIPVDLRGLIDKDLIKEIADTVLAATIEDYKSLEPFILEELKKAGKDGDALAAIYRESIDENGEIRPESPFFEILQRARAEREKKTPHTTAKRAQIVEYPLDKPNSKIWNLLEEDTKGQISFNLAPHGSGKQIPAYYAIDFEALKDNVTITKRLLPFDKRVYIAISALFNAGNNVISLSQIYYAMGNTGTPGLQDYEKINDTITKLTGARIYFDNKAEAETLKGYARFKYDGSLLPIERGTAVINGKLSDAAIHIFREPPLITFAKQRKQITTIDIKLLQSPISKTDSNLLIDDYLIERISKAKAGKGNTCRILKQTIYENAGIAYHPKTNTERQAKKRAPAKIKKYLDHYAKQHFIAGYTEDADGYTIRL